MKSAAELVAQADSLRGPSPRHICLGMPGCVKVFIAKLRVGRIGCFLELNGSKVTDNQWLQPGDEVVMEIDRLGKLTNKILAAD